MERSDLALARDPSAIPIILPPGNTADGDRVIRSRVNARSDTRHPSYISPFRITELCQYHGFSRARDSTPCTGDGRTPTMRVKLALLVAAGLAAAAAKAHDYP